MLSLKKIVEKFESGVKIEKYDNIYKVFKYLRTYDLTCYNSTLKTHTHKNKKINHLKTIRINTQGLDDFGYKYDLTHGLHLFTDNEHNIFFDRTIEQCDRTISILLRHNINYNNSVISDYITFMEKLGRKSKIQKLLK